MKNDPARTIAKMQQVKRAAMAPAQPSAQDRSIAAKASHTEAEARSQLASEKAEAEKEEDKSNNFPGNVYASQNNMFKKNQD